MRGYPKKVATKQDYVNLLSDENYREQALLDLQAIVDLDDSVVQKATTLVDESDPEKGFNMENVENPNPVWKQRGFNSKQEIIDIINAQEPAN